MNCLSTSFNVPFRLKSVDLKRSPACSFLSTKLMLKANWSRLASRHCMMATSAIIVVSVLK
jgi:hypothetical protein